MAGQNNNYYSGCFGGFDCGRYAWAGGPMDEATDRASQSPISATMLLYSWRRDETHGNTYVRRLEYIKKLTDSRPFRMPGGYLADNYEVEFVCNNVTIHEALLASSSVELADT
jgi:hypothetical protein